MGLFKVEILGSSSSGCEYILNFENGVKIQLDAGIKNKDTKDTDLLLVTHEHNDHIKWAKDFEGKKSIFPSDTEHEYITDKIKVKNIQVPHAVLNNGYLIKCDNEKIAYITDIGEGEYKKIKNNFSDLTYLFLECNWDKFGISQGVIPPANHSIYSFSAKGHQSNLSCLNAIAEWKIPKDCKIILIHKSSYHANYETTYKMFESINNKWHIAKKGDVIYTKSWKIV